MNIDRSLQQKDYYTRQIKKDLIVIHHTVNNSAIGTVNYWNSDNRTIGTAYVIDQRGIIYETFNPKYWAYHTGIEALTGVICR